jgi:hypothetical protein
MISRILEVWELNTDVSPLIGSVTFLNIRNWRSEFGYLTTGSSYQPDIEPFLLGGFYQLFINWCLMQNIDSCLWRSDLDWVSV